MIIPASYDFTYDPSATGPSGGSGEYVGEFGGSGFSVAGLDVGFSPLCVGLGLFWLESGTESGFGLESGAELGFDGILPSSLSF